MYVELRLLDRDAVIAPIPTTPGAEKYVDHVQLPDYISLSMSSVMSDIGFLEFSYPSDLAIKAGLGLQSWVAVIVGSDEEDSKIYEPVSVDWFIIENTSVSRAVDGETVAQFQGRSWMSRLEDACAMPYAYDPDIPPPAKWGGPASAMLDQVPLQDATVSTLFSTNRVVTGPGQEVWLTARDTVANKYRCKAVLLPDTTAVLAIERLIGGSVTELARKSVPNLVWAPAEPLYFQFQVIGTGASVSLNAKLWRSGVPLPPSFWWDITASDTSVERLTAAGGVAVGTAVHKSATEVPLTHTFNLFELKEAQTGTVRVLDEFDRTVKPGGWGDAPSAGPYTITAPLASQFSVAPGSGTIETLYPGGNAVAGSPDSAWEQWPGYGTEAMYNTQTAGSILWDLIDKAHRRGTLAVEVPVDAKNPKGLVYELEMWFNGYVDSFGYKPETEDVLVARVASAGQDITTDGYKVIDGVISLVDGDLVLLKDQDPGNPSQNGLWVLRETGPWVQHWSHNQPQGFPDGQRVYVRQGTPPPLGNAGMLFAAEWQAGVLTFTEGTPALLGQWHRTWTGSWPAESKIYEVMRELVEGGMIESRVVVPSADPMVLYEPPRLEVWDYDNLSEYRSTDPPNPVVFRPGQNMKDHEETTDSREILNRVFVMGQDSKLLFQYEHEQPKAILGRIREELAVFEEVDEEAALKALATARLEIQYNPKVQETAGIAPKVYLPWSDFLVGDWVLLDIGQGNTAAPLAPPAGSPLSNIETYYDNCLKATDLNYDSYTRENFGSLYPVRVREISLRVSENGEVEVAVTLNDIIYEQNIKTQRIINSILNAQGAVTGAGNVVDTTGPPQVIWRGSSTRIVDLPTGPKANITVQWIKSPVEAGTLSYMVRYRNISLNQTMGPPDMVDAAFAEYTTPTDLVPGHEYKFTVQAIDRAGNLSALSEELTVLAAADRIPPPAPSTPSVYIIRPADKSSEVNVIGVTWDGNDFEGNPIASGPGVAGVVDFDRVYIYFDQDPDFIPQPGTSRGTLFNEGTELLYETGLGDWYAKLVAVDVTSNASAPSDASPEITIVPVHP